MSTLLFLTRSFPDGFQEAFITAEVPYLAKVFDKVVILPGSPDGTVRRPLPPNVTVEMPLRTTTRHLFYLWCFAVPRTWLYFIRELPRQARENKFGISLVLRVLMQASQRAAYERNEVIRRFVANPQDVVAYSYWGFTTGYALPFLAKAGIPCCVRYHRGDLYLFEDCLPWRDEVASAASVVAFIAQGGLDYFAQNIDVPEDVRARYEVHRLATVDRGVNPPSRDSGKLVLASCSTIYEVKRVHLIARLAKALARKKPVEWHHFGTGENWDLDNELAARCDDLDIHMHGQVTNDAVLEFYRNYHVDIFTNLSTSEGIPVSVMEAISFGIPVVATDVGGTGEAVIDGRSGFLIETDAAEETDALAERIFAELQEGGALARSKPREVWAERFDPDKNHAAFAERLRRLLK